MRDRFRGGIVISGLNVTELVSILPSSDWRDYVTVASFLIGLVGLRAYLDQRRESKNYAPIVEIAKRNVDYKISQDDVKKAQNEANESQEKAKILQKNARQLEEKYKKKQEELEKQMPQIVRTAFLREQAIVHADAAVRSYSEWKNASDELVNLTGSSGAEIDKTAEFNIIDKLIPEHNQRTRKNALRDRITLMSIGLVMLNSVLPSLFGRDYEYYKFYQIASLFLAFFFIASVGELIRPYIVQSIESLFDDQGKKRLMRISFILTYSGALVIGIISFILGILIMLGDNEILPGFIFVAVGLGLVLFFIFNWNHIKEIFPTEIELPWKSHK